MHPTRPTPPGRGRPAGRPRPARPRPPARPWRAALLAAAALAACLAAPSRGAAQTDCRSRFSDPCVDNPPQVYVGPATADSSNVLIRVDWSDDFGLDGATRSVSVNGVPWTESLFTFSRQPFAATSTGHGALHPGTNTVTARICDLGYPPKSMPPQCTSSQQLITVAGAVPPPAGQRVAPSVRLDTHAGSRRDASASASALVYATPAYVSLNTPRSVSLFYSSGQAAQVGFVAVTANDNSADLPSKMSIRLKNSAGVWVTPELFFQAGHGDNRLAASFDASGLATGAYTYTVQVRTYFGTDPTPVEAAPLTADVIVVNENSAVARGWTVPGFSHLYAAAPGGPAGLLRVNGAANGVMYYGGCTGACSYPALDHLDGVLARNGDGTYTLTYPDGGTEGYDAGGLIAYAQDRFGNRTAFTWRWTSEASPRLVPASVQDPAGQAITFQYSDGVHLSSITDPMGRQTKVFWAASGTDIQSIQAPDGSVPLQVAYDAGHRATQWLDHGNAWNFNYDFNGFLSAVFTPSVAADGTTKQLPTWITSIETAQLPMYQMGTAASPSPRVLPAGVRAVVTDPRNFTTRMALDGLGQVTRVEGPLGDWSSVERDYGGRPTRVTTSSGAQVDYEYDGAERLTAMTDHVTGEYASIPSYGAYDLPLVVVHDGVQFTYEYDARGAPLKVRVGTDTVPQLTYTNDSRGRVSAEVDRAGTRMAWYYAPSGAMNTDSAAEITTAGRRLTTFRYDGYGRMAGSRLPSGDTTGIAYDLLNRQTTVTTARGGTVQYQWGPYGLAQLTDPAGKVYQYARNALGWVTSQTDPNGRVSTFGYDAGGNVTSFQGRAGGAVTQTYDAAGRVLTRTANGATTTYSYDGVAGRWMTASNPASTDSLKFDEMGRLVDAVTVRKGHAFELASTFDPNGVRTRLDVPRPWSPALSVTWSYSPLLDLESVLGSSGESVVHLYNLLHQDTLTTYAGGSVKLRTAYTPRGEVAGTTFLNAGANFAFGRTYTYDALSRILTRTNGTGDTTRVFNYDPMGELIRNMDRFNTTVFSCTIPNRFDTCANRDTTIVVGQTQYTYDGVGNRTDAGATLEPGSNRYATFNGFALQYDANGNLVHKSNTATGFDQRLTWNDLGQLASVSRNGGAPVTYEYDGFGRRTRRVDQATGAATQFLYDGDNLFVEMDDAGNTIHRYTHGPGVDDPQAVTLRIADGTLKTYYYTTDLSGNVTGLVDDANNVVNRYAYTPFGQAESVSEGISNPLRFKARELDSTTGLYYNRARWYDPDQGRFISEDPIGLNGGINTYAFAGNDPINNGDPSGLCGSVIEIFGIYFVEQFGCKEQPIQLDGMSNVPGWPFTTPRDAGQSVAISGRGAWSTVQSHIPRIWGGTSDFGNGDYTVKDNGLWSCIFDHALENVHDTNSGVGNIVKWAVVTAAPMAYRAANGAEAAPGVWSAAGKLATGSAAEYTGTFVGTGGTLEAVAGAPGMFAVMGQVGYVATLSGVAFEAGVAIGSVPGAAADCIVPPGYHN